MNVRGTARPADDNKATVKHAMQHKRHATILQRTVMHAIMGIAVFFTTPLVRAQPRLTLPAHDPNQWAGEETAEETIAHALEDLASEQPEARLRAAMLLGKYKHPRAMAGLIGSLTDEVAAVRRAGLVSIAEHPEWLPGLAPRILDMLDDTDVHIRRIASSMLPRIMGGFLAARRIDREQPGIAEAQQHRSRFSPNAANAILSAFRDADATVRENMLTYHYYFIELLTPELIGALLQDPERSVRILAVEAAPRILSDAQFVAAAKTLAADDDRLVRLQTAKMLGRIHQDRALPLLQTMATDDNPEVAAQALLAVVRRGRKPEHVEVTAFLAQDAVDSRTGRLIVSALPGLGRDAEPILRELFEHRRTEYRAAAFHAYADAFARDSDPEAFRAFLDDSSREVRQGVLTILSRSGALESEQIANLAAAPHADVRAHAVRETARLDREQAAALLTELIFDDSTEVRQAAITAMARRRLEGWLRIAVMSLRDRDHGIRRAAAVALAASDDAEADEALDAFMQQVEDEQVTMLIQQIRRQRQAVRQRQEQIRNPGGTR